MAQLSTVAIFLIVAATVLVIAVTIAVILFLLLRRRAAKRAQVMITMTGTTMVGDNGARKIMEAAWVTNKIPFPSPEELEEQEMAKRDSLRYPSIVGGAPLGAFTPSDGSGTGTPPEDIETDLDRTGSPAIKRPENNNVRASYTSAKRLHIPSVLAEHLNEEDEETSGEPARTGSSGNASCSTAADEKHANTIYIESSQSGSSAFEDDPEIQKILKNEREMSAAARISGSGEPVVAGT